MVRFREKEKAKENLYVRKKPINILMLILITQSRQN